MEIKSKILWSRKQGEDFLDGKYKRVHEWIFDGGLRLNASSSPEIVPQPMSDPTLIDPEEAFVTSISSCHMLFFLSIAAKKKFVVNHYEDSPIAILGKDKNQNLSVISLVLNPLAIFEATRIPDEKTIHQLHELAHSNCFLANSTNTKITIKL